MKVLLLDSSTPVMVDTYAIILNSKGHDARAVHNSADAVRLASEFKPDWFFIILNNINDAKPHDVVLDILRIHPSCKFFLTAGRPMPDFEDKLWESGYALQNVLPLPIHPIDLLDTLTGKDSMIVRAVEGRAPKFIMFRE
jgi:hypothetical protein